MSALPAIDLLGQGSMDLDRLYTQVQAEMARNDLRVFVKQAWHQVEPKPYVSNWHIDAVCDHLAYVTIGEIRNLIVNIPPRSTKSLLAGVLWPVWDWLQDPRSQFMCASYASELAIRDAEKARRLITSGWFQERYGTEFFLDAKDNRKTRYLNNHGGHRISTSVGAKTTGDGGDKILVDDPHNAKEVYSDAKRMAVLNWWDNAMRSRLNDPTTGQKILIGQRTHDNDLFGHVIDTEGDRWVVLCLPMEFERKRRCITYANPRGAIITEEEKRELDPIFIDPRKKDGELLNEQRFGPEEVETERHGMSTRDYSAQFQQDPTSGDGLILKRKYWRQWVYPPGSSQAGKPMPMPEMLQIISVYDTAFEKDEEADFSARTSWGLFEWEEKPGKSEINLILLERMNDRLSFPELKEAAIEHKEVYNPDVTLIEKKASGHSLIQELRQAGVKVKGIPLDGKDKIFRAHMVEDVLRSGRVWYIPRVWAQEVINQCAKFPVGQNDDLVDTCVIAWAYVRRLGLVELPSDEEDEEVRLFATPKFYG